MPRSNIAKVIGKKKTSSRKKNADIERVNPFSSPPPRGQSSIKPYASPTGSTSKFGRPNPHVKRSRRLPSKQLTLDGFMRPTSGSSTPFVRYDRHVPSKQLGIRDFMTPTKMTHQSDVDMSGLNAGNNTHLAATNHHDQDGNGECSDLMWILGSIKKNIYNRKISMDSLWSQWLKNQ